MQKHAILPNWFLKEFPSDDACKAHILRIKSCDPFICMHCGREDTLKTRTGRYRTQCASCRTKVSWRNGTIFKGTHLPPMTWVQCIYFITSKLAPVPNQDIMRLTGISNPTTLQRVTQDIRRLMSMNDPARLGSSATKQKPIDIGAFHITGVNQHIDGLVILIAFEGSGKDRTLRLTATQDRTISTASPALSNIIERDAHIAVTEHNRSIQWQRGRKHILTDQQAKRLDKEISRIQTLVNRWLSSTYCHAVKPLHLHWYLCEFEFHINQHVYSSTESWECFWEIFRRAVKPTEDRAKVFLSRDYCV